MEFNSAKLLTIDRMALQIYPESHPFFTLTELKLYVGGPIMLLRPESFTDMGPVLIVNFDASDETHEFNSLASEVMGGAFVFGLAVLCGDHQLQDGEPGGLTETIQIVA